jgi:WD40 repeat protein
VQDGSGLRVKNRIYSKVFNIAWVEQQLGQLRPYAYALDAWVISGRQDESRLLRGQALLDAQQWSQGKRLSDLDYQFLSASVESDRQQVQQALEADRVTAVEAQLFQEKRNVRLQRWFLITHSIGLLTSLGLVIGIFWLYRQSQASEQTAKLSQVKALVSSSEGSFDSNRQLEGLVQAIQARTELQMLKHTDATLGDRTAFALQQSLYGIDEANRFTAEVGINAVAASPNGEWIVSACADGTLRLWTPDGILVRTIAAHRAGVVAVAFSPDSQRLLSASSDTTVKVWQIDGTPLQTLKGHRAEIVQAKFSPDGQQIASVSEDGVVKVWGQTGHLQQTLGPATSLAFSPQGLLALSGRGPIRIWRRDGTFLQTLSSAPTSSGALAFSPDGQTLAQVAATMDKNGLYLWRLDGTLKAVFQGPETGGIRDLTFSPDGRWIATAGNDRVVRLWQPGSGLYRSFKGHQATVWSVAFNPDGKTLLSASDDRTIRLWTLDNPWVDVLGGNPGPIMKLAVNPVSGQIVSVSADRQIVLFQPDHNGSFAHQPPKTLLAHRAPIRGVAFRADGRFFATASRDRTVILWTTQGAPVQTLQNNGQVEGVAFSPKDNSLAIASEDGTVKIWRPDATNTFRPKPDQMLQGHQATVKRVAFSPDGTRLVSASVDQTLKLWDTNGTLLKTLKGHRAEVRDTAFSPDGTQIVSVAADNTLKLWRQDGTLLRTFLGHQGAVWAVAFSPDGQYIVSSSMDSTIKIWRLDGTLAYTLKRHSAGVRSIAFSPDGKWLISGSDDQTLLLWHLNQVFQLDGSVYACRWVRNFLQISPSFREEKASICQNVPSKIQH